MIFIKNIILKLLKEKLKKIYLRILYLKNINLSINY